MARILVLYYSSYGHVEQMARSVAEGARSVSGTDVTVKRVPELVPEEVARKSGMKVDQEAPIAIPNELAEYDAIIFGTPTRFGNMAAQMRNFLDQTGGLWVKGALVGKVGGVFASTGTQHGGQETTITSFHSTLLHQGMIIVGLPYTFAGMTRMDEITGGSPYGASTLAGGDGSRQPTDNELDGARYQGRHIAEIASRLQGGAGQCGPQSADMQTPQNQSWRKRAELSGRHRTGSSDARLATFPSYSAASRTRLCAAPGGGGRSPYGTDGRCAGAAHAVHAVGRSPECQLKRPLSFMR